MEDSYAPKDNQKFCYMSRGVEISRWFRARQNDVCELASPIGDDIKPIPTLLVFANTIIHLEEY